MSKNIIIHNGKQIEAIDNVSKLETDLSEGGTCYWIPEDGVRLIPLTVTKNGTYKASEKGYYGFSEVNASGIGSTIIGDYAEKDIEIKENGVYEYKASDDGHYGYSQVKVSVQTTKDYSISRDPSTGNEISTSKDRKTGQTVSTTLPSYIRVETLPYKTNYIYGEAMDYTGIEVYAYTQSGERWQSSEYPNGRIPFDELILPTQEAGTTITDNELIEKEYSIYPKAIDGYTLPIKTTESFSFKYNNTNYYTYSKGHADAMAVFLKEQENGRYEGYVLKAYKSNNEYYGTEATYKHAITNNDSLTYGYWDPVIYDENNIICGYRMSKINVLPEYIDTISGVYNIYVDPESLPVPQLTSYTSSSLYYYMAWLMCNDLYNLINIDPSCKRLSIGKPLKVIDSLSLIYMNSNRKSIHNYKCSTNNKDSCKMICYKINTNSTLDSRKSPIYILYAFSTSPEDSIIIEASSYDDPATNSYDAEGCFAINDKINVKEAYDVYYYNHSQSDLRYTREVYLTDGKIVYCTAIGLFGYFGGEHYNTYDNISVEYTGEGIYELDSYQNWKNILYPSTNISYGLPDSRHTIGVNYAYRIRGISIGKCPIYSILAQLLFNTDYNVSKTYVKENNVLNTDIRVGWHRPKDNKQLNTAFQINIASRFDEGWEEQ